jgi:hypothetical protein
MAFTSSPFVVYPRRTLAHSGGNITWRREREEEIMEERGSVCLEEEVERMRESGMEADAIADRMGVDAGWVESLFMMWEGGEPEEEGG